MRQRSLINFEELTSLKDVIQVEEEKLLENISLFYSSRIDFGKYIFKSCNLGVIGELIRILEIDISKGQNLNSDSLNIRENSKLMLEWILELEKVFLNTEDDNKIFHVLEEMSDDVFIELLTKKIEQFNIKVIFYKIKKFIFQLKPINSDVRLSLS